MAELEITDMDGLEDLERRSGRHDESRWQISCGQEERAISC
jgi:hypothetical protein